jgi:hypothetical protein
MRAVVGILVSLLVSVPLWAAIMSMLAYLWVKTGFQL